MPPQRQREFFTDNQMVRIHVIIVMIRWTGLAPREFEFPFSGSLTSTFLVETQVYIPLPANQLRLHVLQLVLLLVKADAREVREL